MHHDETGLLLDARTYGCLARLPENRCLGSCAHMHT